MGAVTISEMLELEASAKQAGWSEANLLEKAGENLGRAVGQFFVHPGTMVAYLGKGHNAGDALVALRVLRDEFGWEIAMRCGFPFEECAPLVQEKWLELGPRIELIGEAWWESLQGPLVLLDGLLGSGAKGRLRAPLLELATEMQWLRKHQGVRVAAVDLPSGIDADSGEIFPDTVIADVTFMIANAKRGLLTGCAANAVGALALVPLEPLAHVGHSDWEMICPQRLEIGKAPRAFDFHKGNAGRVAILAGSEAYSGAAVLAATGALRGGAGLITLFVPKEARAVITARCPAEVIVRSFESPCELLDFRFDSLVIGCGLGEIPASMESNFFELITKTPVPTVLDADALNAIAKAGKQEIFNEKHLLTPHPGEFVRLAPDLCDLAREEMARCFVARISATLLFKGSRTIVTASGAPLWMNSTGSPGMATGGQGDLLSGVIGAQLAGGKNLLEAAMLSAWLCGRSAEIALQELHLSEESLTPSDVAHFLGAAFRDWKTSNR